MSARVAGPTARSCGPDDAVWGQNLYPRACVACGRRYAAAPEVGECPCGGALEGVTAPVPPEPPERVLAAQVDRVRLSGLLATSLRDRPRPGADAARLAASASLVYWPRWLLDVHATGSFAAEVAVPVRGSGSVDRRVGGQWVTTTEDVDRVVWEPRAGRVDRRLREVEVPALVDEAALVALAAGGRAAETPPVPPALVLLPDRWPDAGDDEVEARAREVLAAEILRATLGERARDLRIAMVGDAPRWRLMLHPAWWVPDPEGGEPGFWMVDGLSGRVAPSAPGVGRASSGMRIAVVVAGVVALLGLVCGAAGLGILALFS